MTRPLRSLRGVACLVVAGVGGTLAPGVVVRGASTAAAATAAVAAAPSAAIALPADVNAREVDGTTPLHWAAHDGDAARVAVLLRAGARVDVVNDFGATPLSEAAAIGAADVLALLLKAGADVNAGNREGQTALMAVARTGHVDAAEVLLKHGAKVDTREQWGGQTALIFACAERQPDVVRLLIRHHADVNARATVRDWQRRVTAEGRPKDMNRGGLTPLLYAAREGCRDCVRHLLDAHAQIDLTDPDRTTPLLVALLNLHFDLAMDLIRRGAALDKWDLFGQSPLYVATDMNTLPRSQRGDLPSLDQATAYDVMVTLLERGANPDLQLIVRPPFRHAVGDRLSDPMLGTGATPLLRAAKAADLAAIRLLLLHHARVDLANADGVTPFMAAAGTGSKPGKETRGRFRTEADAIEAVRLLRAAGADVRARTSEGETALHSAAQLGWNDMVRELAGYHLALDAADTRGLTPVDFALGRNPTSFLETQRPAHRDTAELLRTLGAKQEHPDYKPPPQLGVPTITTTTTAT